MRALIIIFFTWGVIWSSDCQFDGSLDSDGNGFGSWTDLMSDSNNNSSRSGLNDVKAVISGSIEGWRFNGLIR